MCAFNSILGAKPPLTVYVIMAGLNACGLQSKLLIALVTGIARAAETSFKRFGYVSLYLL